MIEKTVLNAAENQPVLCSCVIQLKSGLRMSLAPSAICKPSLFLVLFLCLSVMAQMLGVPTTLLNPAADSDILGASVLEGFSVPPCFTHLDLMTKVATNFHLPPTGNGPILVASLFHPPCCN